jgi:hypothetical protein
MAVALDVPELGETDAGHDQAVVAVCEAFTP